MIEVRNLTKKFKERTVLNDLSFEVKQGEIFGYLGSNGAGKTTTMKVLLGLLKPTSGKALVWGQNLGQNDSARKKVGVLLENDGLFERLSAYENLDYYAQLYGVPRRHEKIEELLKFVGLSERKGGKTGNFSKGMKRKLGLARAIIHNPEVLFLDEPSAGLDPEAQKMVRDLILRLSGQENMTIFLNSHDLDEVQRVCSKIAILQEGQIKAYDTLDNLRRQSVKPVVEVIFSNNQDTEKALNLLRATDYVVDARRLNSGIAVTMVENQGSPALLNLLMQNGLKVEEIKRVVRGLEDIYLDVMRRETK